MIKSEYYFGVSIWPLFAVSGAAFLFAAVYIDYFILRSILGINGFTFLWSIIELFHQRERKRKGWYPENP